MATNDFLPFAIGGGANVLTQAQYAALTTLLSGGYQSGVANSAQMNKTWRQSSIMAAVLGQFAADYSGNNSVDDGTIATLEANLVAAIRSATKTGVILADTGAANAYTAVNAPPLVAGTWVDGVVQQVRIAHANTGASTYSPDGLTAIPIYGLGLQPLQGSELVLNGIAILVRMTIAGVNSGNPIAVLMECAGGAQQVAPATQSQHAVQYGQMLGGGYTVTTSVTYTNGLASNGAVVLANNTAYQAKNTGGTAFPISYIDASNNVTYGNASLALAIVGASATITPMLTMTNGAVLPNNVGYQAKTTGGAATTLAFIDTSNNVNLGNNGLPTVIGGSSIQAVQPVSVGIATAAAHAVRYDQSFGIGQTLTNVLASRAIGTTYTNSTGKLITVNVAASAGGSGSAIGIFVSGMGEASASIATAAAQALAINATVPAGGTYVVQQSGPTSTLASWYELR